MFLVNLKALLGLILVYQYCQGDILSQATPTPSLSLLHSTVALYDSFGMSYIYTFIFIYDSVS